jgi:four helix bundle protein
MGKENNVILTKTFDFAVRIVNFVKYLKIDKSEHVLAKQILRSGTSIGANVEEAIGGFSKSDFIYKLNIAYKESRETMYWLKLLFETKYIEEKIYNSLKNDLDEILKILYTIIKTSKTKK